MKKLIALTLVALSLYGLEASAASVIRTPPVTAKAPAGITNRGLRCVGQNFGKKAVPIFAEVVYADGTVSFSDTVTVEPQNTAYIQSIYGGSGFRYCRFTVSNKTTVKGWLEVEDDGATSLVLEAK